MATEAEDRLARARQLIAEAVELCAQLSAPIAANHLCLGLELLEQSVHPGRIHQLPDDLATFTPTDTH